MIKSKRNYVKKYIELILQIGKKGVFYSFFFMLIVTGINITLPQIIQIMVDDGIVKENYTLLIQTCVVYMLLLLVAKFTGVVLENYFGKLKLKVTTELKKRICSGLCSVNGKYISKKKTGNILRILDNDIYQVEDFGIDTLYELILNIITGLVVLIILIKYNIYLLILTALIQFVLFLINNFMTKKIGENINEIREISGKQSNIQEQFVSNLNKIILANLSNELNESIMHEQLNYVKKSKKVNLLISVQSAVASGLNSLGIILTYLVGGIMIIQKKMSIGELLAFIQYISLLVSPCLFLVNYSLKIRQLSVALKNIYNEILDIEESNDYFGNIILPEGGIKKLILKMFAFLILIKM